MKDELKEILQLIGNCCYYGKISEDKCEKYCNYITNLQEKSNNQAEEINRLYKQREKFMKKYGYLKEENERLRKELELCKKNGEI